MTDPRQALTDALAAALHTGRLDNGEWLCSMHAMPLVLCPATPHTPHVAAIIESHGAAFAFPTSSIYLEKPEATHADD